MLIPMTTLATSGLAFLFELVVTWLTIQRYEALVSEIPLLQTGQLTFLFGFCLILGLAGLAIGRWKPRYAFGFFLVKGLGLVLILLLLPVLDLGCLPYLLAFLLTLGLGLDTRGFLVVVMIVLAMFFTMARVLQIPVRSDSADLPLMLLSLLLFVAAAVVIRRLVDKWRQTKENELRLSNDVVHLINLNTDLQSFAMTIEHRTLDEERKRLSREIHDTVGYTLTTLKLLFEAAKGLIEQDPAELAPLMDQGLTYTRQSLDEIRGAMRELRQSALPVRTGRQLIVTLVKNFRSVTHMTVSLELPGTRRSYGTWIDEFLYKCVQEALTNAYRHGKASEVSIILQETQRKLYLRVSDNGPAARNFVKGIGLRGMEERVAKIGGTIEFSGSEAGFQVIAMIPVPEMESS